ncbi:MAG: BtpA/SgcQ family protein [Patescibacteria group bacterium]
MYLPKKRCFLAVIHHQSLAQARKNVIIAMENGADGVFLIPHGQTTDNSNVCVVAKQIKAEFPNFWIGLNILEAAKHNFIAFNSANEGKLDGVWTNNMGILWQPHNGIISYRQMISTTKHRRCNNYTSKYFGGFQFKDQDQLPDDKLPEAVARSIRHTEVLTTSGDKTGEPPTVAKIRNLRNIVNQVHRGRKIFPIGIASGINHVNVIPLLEFAQYFLVASSISTDEYNLDPFKVERLADAIKKG